MSRFKTSKRKSDVLCAIRTVARAAARRFPFYRSLFTSAGVEPETLRDLDTLQRFPITSKRLLFSSLWEGVEDVARWDPLTEGDRHVKWSTSGMTGPLLYVHMSRAEALFRRCIYLRAWRQNAKLPWPLVIAQVGASPRQARNRRSRVQRLGGLRIERIDRLLPLDDQVRRLISAHPHLVTAHPSNLALVASHMVEKGLRLPVRLVVTRGEVLTPETRRLLSAAFDGKVVDYYNAQEFGNIAYECPADPGIMHVNTDGCFLEILDEAGERVPTGEEGRIVVTNLFNCTMPFLRYDVGDRGRLISEDGGRCACGSRRPAMEPPLGRSGDVFTYASGIRLSPRIIEALVVPVLIKFLRLQGGGVHGLPAYRVIQQGESAVCVLLEGEIRETQALEREIEEGFRRQGVEVTVSLKPSGGLSPEDCGKTRRVVSIPQT